MKIAIVAPPWVAVPPVGYGGTEAVLDGLARGLSHAGHDVLLYTTGDSTAQSRKPGSSKRPSASASAAPSASCATSSMPTRPRGWLRHRARPHPRRAGLRGARSRTCPSSRPTTGPSTASFVTTTGRFGDRVPVIAISDHQASTAAEIPVAGVIHHGIDVDKFALGTGAGGYALFLGRMSPDKGVHTAIRIARRAGVPLKIAAKLREQPEYEYFEERVRPLLGGDIEFVGEVAGAGEARAPRRRALPPQSDGRGPSRSAW